MTIGLTAGGACLLLLLLLVGSRLAESPKQPELDLAEVRFVEQIGHALDALQSHCAESRYEISMAVLDLQQRRMERGESGSALDLLHGIRGALRDSGGQQRCIEVAEKLAGAS